MAKETAPKKEKVAKAAPPASKAKKEAGGQEKGVAARLFERYKKETVPSLMKRFQYTTRMQVPRLEKISINIGVGTSDTGSKVAGCCRT